MSNDEAIQRSIETKETVVVEGRYGYLRPSNAPGNMVLFYDYEKGYDYYVPKERVGTSPPPKEEPAKEIVTETGEKYLPVSTALSSTGVGYVKEGGTGEILVPIETTKESITYGIVPKKEEVPSTTQRIDVRPGDINLRASTGMQEYGKTTMITQPKEPMPKTDLVYGERIQPPFLEGGMELKLPFQQPIPVEEIGRQRVTPEQFGYKAKSAGEITLEDVSAFGTYALTAAGIGLLGSIASLGRIGEVTVTGTLKEKLALGLEMAVAPVTYPITTAMKIREEGAGAIFITAGEIAPFMLLGGIKRPSLSEISKPKVKTATTESAQLTSIEARSILDTTGEAIGIEYAGTGRIVTSVQRESWFGVKKSSQILTSDVTMQGKGIELIGEADTGKVLSESKVFVQTRDVARPERTIGTGADLVAMTRRNVPEGFDTTGLAGNIYKKGEHGLDFESQIAGKTISATSMRITEGDIPIRELAATEGVIIMKGRGKPKVSLTEGLTDIELNRIRQGFSTGEYIEGRQQQIKTKPPSQDILVKSDIIVSKEIAGKQALDIIRMPEMKQPQKARMIFQPLQQRQKTRDTLGLRQVITQRTKQETFGMPRVITGTGLKLELGQDERLGLRQFTIPLQIQGQQQFQLQVQRPSIEQSFRQQQQLIITPITTRGFSFAPTMYGGGFGIKRLYKKGKQKRIYTPTLTGRYLGLRVSARGLTTGGEVRPIIVGRKKRRRVGRKKRRRYE